jgi:hypothetical protein
MEDNPAVSAEAPGKRGARRAYGIATAAMGVGAAALAMVTAACGGEGKGSGPSGPAWPQWGQSAQHTGTLPVTGQALDTVVLDYPYDPFVFSELWSATASAHYMTPLTEGSAVYAETKSGTYSLDTYSTQTWGIVRFNWVDGAFVQQWQANSDWKAVGGTGDFWEPVFHGALAGGYLYVPGAMGTLLKVDEATGAVVSRIVPDSAWDASTYAVSPIAVDATGNLYFTVLRLPVPGAVVPSAAAVVGTNDGVAAPTGFYARDVVDSFLVQVDSHDATRTVSVSSLVAGAPGPADPCETTFGDADLPWPPGADAVAPTADCGTTRVALNAAPAVALDGTIYVVTRAHFNSRYTDLVAVNPDLTPKWTASLRDRFEDGCGVPRSLGGQLEPNGAPEGCAVGARYGVDPATNRPGAGRALDDSSSSPVVAPDGSVFYGASTSYNYSQGHLMRFSAAGAYLNAYPFGWDTTPALYAHDGTYSVVTKDNHYGATGSYCSSATYCPADRTMYAPDYPEGYFVTQLSADLAIQWQYRATNEERCEPGGDGGLACVADHPASFEWCVNAPAIDANGNVYANSEDGWLYAIAQGGTVSGKIFQQASTSAAYTPVALGPDGKVYSQNSGHLFAIGR